MEVPRLRPLGIGEILDVAVTIYRRNFVTLVKVVAVVVAPVGALSALVQLSLPGEDEVLVDETGAEIDGGAFLAFVGGLLVLGVLTAVAATIASAASFKAVAEAYLGGRPEWRPSLRFAARRWHSLLWVTFLVTVLAALALLACIVPGVYLYYAWGVAIPVLLLEDRRGRRALGRSRQLVKGRWWPVAGALTLGLLLTTIVSGGLSGVVGGVVVAGVDNEVGAVLLGAVADTVGTILTTPFTAALVTVVYVDLRVRKEGFDIELLAAGVGAEAGGEVLVPPAPAARPDAGGSGDGADDDQPPFWPPPPDWRPGSR